MGLVQPFYVNDGTSNVEYREVPSTSLNARKYAKGNPEVNGAKSFIEAKVTEDGKGANATLRYLVSKTLEVPGPDGVMRAAKVNFTIAIPSTALSINRGTLVSGMIAQVVSFLMTNPAVIGSSDGADTIAIPGLRVAAILNGEI